MATGQIVLPADGSGPNVATRTFTEDALTKHLMRCEPDNNRLYSGLYSTFFDTITAVSTTADTATGGRAWLLNPVGSSVLVAISLLRVVSYRVLSNVRATGPLFTLERMTFTGVSTATPVADAEKRETQAASVALPVTATTGITPAAGAVVASFFPLMQMSVASQTPGRYSLNVPLDEVEQLVLGAGEGVVLRQSEAGAATDGARFLKIGIEYSEFSEI